MPLYKDFPSLTYRLQEKNIGLRDITRRVAIRRELKDVEGLTFSYVIKDGERPEDIAYRVYGSPQHHWIILAMNDIIDPYSEWPKTHQQLLDELTEQFGTLEDGISESNIHHWETPEGYIIPADPLLRENGANDNVDVGAMPISWYNWVLEENEAKRGINILLSAYLSDVLSEAEQLLRQ